MDDVNFFLQNLMHFYTSVRSYEVHCSTNSQRALRLYCKLLLLRIRSLILLHPFNVCRIWRSTLHLRLRVGPAQPFNRRSVQVSHTKYHLPGAPPHRTPLHTMFNLMKSLAPSFLLFIFTYLYHFVHLIELQTVQHIHKKYREHLECKYK